MSRRQNVFRIGARGRPLTPNSWEIGLVDTYDNPHQTWGAAPGAVVNATVDERTSFIRRTYLTLTGAVLACAGLDALLLSTPLAQDLVQLMVGGRWSWLIVVGAFVGISYLATAWATSGASSTKQYLGLSLYVVCEALILLPLLYIAQQVSPQSIPAAGLLTVLVFGGLTAIVFMSKADFTFLGPALGIAGLVAIGVCVCSALFGFSLGVLFSGCMVALASGYILYETSAMLHQFRVDQHVAAALALFASVAMLFFYFLRLMMQLQSRD